MAAAATPFPKEDSTPPVIKMILVFTGFCLSLYYREGGEVKRSLLLIFHLTSTLR